jgi:hypothetical protein
MIWKSSGRDLSIGGMDSVLSFDLLSVNNPNKKILI